MREVQKSFNASHINTFNKIYKKSHSCQNSSYHLHFPVASGILSVLSKPLLAVNRVNHAPFLHLGQNCKINTSLKHSQRHLVSDLIP